jgi:hypothetical protein
MAQTVTLISLLAAAVALIWSVRRRLPASDSLLISIRLDRSAPGAHLIWDITNIGPAPVTLTHFMIYARRHGRGRGESDAKVPLPLPETLERGDHALVPIDVDWRLLAARSIAVFDASGRKHPAARHQLASVQEHLRELVDRRMYTRSARDWLSGAADLAFGVVILGLGFFMLMWVIATG